MAAPASTSASIGSADATVGLGGASDLPELLAVVADSPTTLSAAASAGPFAAYPCELSPLHLAAALGREQCVKALLDTGASPFLWTRPPKPQHHEEGAAVDEDCYSNYEGVCSSGVYQALKQQLPNSSAFPYTFTLAQLLLRTPCSALMLAVRFGQQAAARMLLAAMEPAAGSRGRRSSSGRNRSRVGASGSSSNSSDSVTTSSLSLSLHLDAALAYWPVASEPQAELLRRLLGAGSGVQPLRRLLPAVLARYDNCNPQSSMAEKLRAGLREVLAHVLPQVPPSQPGVAAVPAGTPPGWRRGIAPPTAPTLRQLLTAAVVCRDQRRCPQLLAALDASEPAPWSDVAANCVLLVAAAGHDMAGVVEYLLALPPPPGHGLPPFNANMWGPEGLSVMMTAAHRGSLGALGSLLAAGAAVNLADEMGATALHWAVVGGSQEAVMMLAQHGAAVDLAGVVHEEEEHLERPLLTATARSNLPMIRILAGLGASLDAPAPSGSTALSVAVCWEQLEAARLLLQLGANPNQMLPTHVNGGCYPMWSDSYSAEEAHTLLGLACSRIEFKEHLSMLLRAGADPTLRHPKTGLTPAAEAASIGALEEAAMLIQMTTAPKAGRTLGALGWPEAVAQAAGNFYWHHSAYPAEAMEPLLEAWRRQPEPALVAPPPAACRAIVASLLAHPALQLAEGATQLQAGAELAGVLQAERLASVGICADLTNRLAASSCRSVLLAAAPASTRWSPTAHPFFPPSFKQAVRLLLLVNNHLAANSRRSSDTGGGGIRNKTQSRSASMRATRTQAFPVSAAGQAEPEEAEPEVACCDEPGGGGGVGGKRRLPKVGSTPEISDKKKGAVADAGCASLNDNTGVVDSAGDSNNSCRDTSRPGTQLPDRQPSAAPDRTAAADAGEYGSCSIKASPFSSTASASSFVAAAAGSAAAATRRGREGVGGVRGLPRDAVLEVARHLGAMPLSFWMCQAQGQPVSGSRVASPLQLPDSVV